MAMPVPSPLPLPSEGDSVLTAHATRQSSQRRTSKLDVPVKFSPEAGFSCHNILRGSVMDASRYVIGSLRNLKREEFRKFNKLNFSFCTNETIRTIFPIPSSRENIMNGVVPLSYRHNAQQIRNYLFYGAKQKKALLMAECLWNENNIEVEVFRGPPQLPTTAFDHVDTHIFSSESYDSSSDEFINPCPGINLDHISKTSNRKNVKKSIEGFKHILRESIRVYADIVTKDLMQWKYDPDVCGVIIKKSAHLWLCHRGFFDGES